MYMLNLHTKFHFDNKNFVLQKNIQHHQMVIDIKIQINKKEKEKKVNTGGSTCGIKSAGNGGPIITNTQIM